MNKKLLALILCVFCLASVLALASCGGGGTDTDTDEGITIYLVLDGGYIDYDEEFNVMPDEDFELPTPVKPGYTFNGWLVDDEPVEGPYFSFSEDTELVASWKKTESSDNTYTVTLYLNGGTLAGYSNSFNVTKGEKIDLAVPTKEGYTFIAWYVDDEEIEFPYTVNSDIDLVAEWRVSSSGGNQGGNQEDGPAVYYTVTFDPKGGTFSGETSIQVKSGDKIPEPPKPVYEGKTFNGWYSGTTSSSKWNFETMTVSGDVTLSAWYIGGGGCAHEETIPLPNKSTAATCEKGGKEYVKCTKCGLETYSNVPKLGHLLETEVVPVTCATDGYTRVYCTREGCTEDRTHTVIPATGNHTWSDEYVTVVEPTQYVGGQEAKTCTVCGAQDIFKIPSYAEMDDLLWDLDIGNYTYTGGKYVNASFVNIAKTAGISATSFYTVCGAINAIDGAAGSFWCADTLADGAKFSGDVLELSFAQKFDIGMVKLSVPHYSSWELGDDCYVAYELEAFIDGEWQTVGILSDKNALAAGSTGSILCEFESPINTDKLRLTVKHSTRFAPATIYEIEVMAAVEKTERVTTDLISSSTITSSGKYNSWATGTETLMDGSYDSYWQSNYNNKASVGEIFATITFPDDTFVTSVQFAVSADKNQQHSIYYLAEDGETWVLACTYNVVKGKNVTFKGDSNGDGVADGTIITSKKGNKRALFTCDIVKFTKAVKLVIDSDAEAWAANVYEFTPYTAVEQAVVQSVGNRDGILTYTGCQHSTFKTVEVVAPTCTNAGYTLSSCYGCGFECTTDAVDAYGHLWGSYNVAVAAEGTNAGTKNSYCMKDDCDAVRTTSYYNDFEDPKITTYLNNAPAAWAQTLDDGNYLGTYNWLIPKLQQYGWKASVMLSITFCDSYVSNWQEYLTSGVLDIGSHSYTHGGYYSGQISENALLSDVHNAHYWFMNNFHGQKILTFATPNGATSTGTSEYVTGLMSSARNGGASKYFYNRIEELQSNGYGQSPYVGEITVDEETGEVIFTQATNKSDGSLVWVTTRRAFGNMNSYISKSDQTEGTFVLIKKDGTLATTKYKKVTQVPVIDETTGEQAVDEKGNLVWEKLSTPIYEETSGGYDKDQGGNYNFNEKGGNYSIIKSPSGSYFYVANSDLKVNYRYDSVSNRLKDFGIEGGGTYRYVETKNDKGTQTDSYYEWVSTGSYNADGTFRNDNNGEYMIIHTALGSYEKGINEILAVGGMTVECLHEIGNGGTIWSTYTSTNSKFQYLQQTGIWVCSYTELIQYMKEQLSATVTLIERTDSKVVLTLTDTLDDYMFNFPLTIEVDIDDSWVELGIIATQAGKEIDFFVKDGKVYVNAVPDAGKIVVTPAILCTDGTVNHDFEWETVDEPTCTEDGVKNGKCSKCGFEKSGVVVEALGHTFDEDAWELVSEASCTEPTKYENACKTCGHTVYDITVEAYGHTYGEWISTLTEDGIQGTTTCSVCQNEIITIFENTTKNDFKTPTAMGDAWGTDTGALVNGDFTDTPIAPKDTGAFIVTLEAGVPTYVDVLAVAGYGSKEYSVKVFFADGSSEELGVGYFDEGEEAITYFNVGKEVKMFVITMAEPSNGGDKWSEIATLVVK